MSKDQERVLEALMYEIGKKYTIPLGEIPNGGRGGPRDYAEARAVLCWIMKVLMDLDRRVMTSFFGVSNSCVSRWTIKTQSNAEKRKEAQAIYIRATKQVDDSFVEDIGSQVVRCPGECGTVLQVGDDQISDAYGDDGLCESCYHQSLKGDECIEYEPELDEADGDPIIPALSIPDESRSKSEIINEILRLRLDMQEKLSSIEFKITQLTSQLS